MTNFALAVHISIVPARAFRNAFPIMQHSLLSTGEASGTTGATALTGLLTSVTGALLVVEGFAAAALTAALPQHVQGIPAAQAVLLRRPPAACAGLVADCRQTAESVQSRPQKVCLSFFSQKPWNL